MREILAAAAAAAIVLMALKLRALLKITLYAYTNVGLIGGILFAGTFLLWMIGDMIFLPESVCTLREAVIGFPRRFSMLAVAVIFAVSVAVMVSNIALMRREGACPGNALGVLLGAFFVGGTLALYFVADRLEEYFGADPAKQLINTAVSMFLLTMLSYFECVFAGSCVMGYLTARHVPAYDKDFIIILGCSIDRRGGLLPLLKGRANRAVRFAWDQEIATGKPCLYVPSGGQGPNEVMSEGSAMELYLLSHGAEPEEVFPEKRSRDTYENMLFSKKIIDGLKPDAKIAFATTNYHTFRSGILARKAGFDAEGIASDTKWYFWPNGFVREFFAILALKRSAHLKVAAVTAAVCAAVCLLV